MSGNFDAVVIGGGFYGCSIACFLKESRQKVLLVERESDLFRHASYANQARIHNGYHYPRSLLTANRSRVNFQRFTRDFPECVENGFVKLYCIARNRSKVNARQFERFCNIIGAPWKPARPEYQRLFNSLLIEAVYEVTEYAFNSNTLRDTMRERLARAGVEVRLNARVESVGKPAETLEIELSGSEAVRADLLINCTYAGLRRIPGLYAPGQTPIKLEIAEMALIKPPEELRSAGVTVMCGPFFSIMPFPPRSLHSLSHVRYTPHGSWTDSGEGGEHPYSALRASSLVSRSRHMLQDAQRYLPVLEGTAVVDSLFEAKALLVRNELDDGRPILMERCGQHQNAWSVMGGKIDNIYDVIERMRTEGL